MQFLEQMKYSDQKIASIYRVPPHMVGDISNSTSWGTGIEEQAIQFVRHTLLPIIRKLEEGFEASLLTGTQFQMRFVTNALLRASTAARADFYTKLWQMGVINADEIRGLEEMAPQANGTGATYYVPMNYAPAGTEPLPVGAAALAEATEEGRL
jgi:HK97 family phage portal protein